LTRTHAGVCAVVSVARADVHALQARGTSQLRVGLPADPRRISADVAPHRPLLRCVAAERRLHQHDPLRRVGLLSRRQLSQQRRIHSPLGIRQSQSASAFCCLIYFHLEMFRFICNKKYIPCNVVRHIAECIMIDTVIFNVRNCLISTSGLKSNVAVVFLDPDFLYDTGIPAIHEHYMQKLAYLCSNGFSAPFGPK